MVSVPRAAAVASALAALALTINAQPVAAAAPASPGQPHRDRVHGAGAASAQPATAAPLAFQGGSVLTAPAVYLSFWGPEWNSGFTSGGYTSGQAATYLETFFQGVGGSSWVNVATQYCQGVGVGTTTCPAGVPFVGNPTGQFLNAWVDTTTVPASPTGSDIAAAAVRAEAHFGYRPGAIYFVMTPSGKSESGFGTASGGWCAWHSGTTAGGNQIPYAYLPFLPDAGNACGVNAVNANDGFGDGYFDGFSIVGGHEYMEAITDPFPNSGWVDSSGEENGDKCQWTGLANQTLGGHAFAVQPTWSNAIGGCALTAGSSVPTPTPTPVPTPVPGPITFTSYFSWYDNASAGMASDNIHIVNPGGSPVSGTLAVAGRAVSFTIGASGEGYYAFPPGTIGGPVVVSATSRVIASQRVQYYSSFNEVAARTAADAATDEWFPWYDKASPGMAGDNIHLVNPNGTQVTGTVTVGPAAAPIATGSFSIAANGTGYVTFPEGTIGGPIHVHSNGGGVLASQRVQYYSTFNEAAGQGSGAAASTLYFNWYDLASPGMVNDNVHLVNPGSSQVSGSVRVASTGATASFTVGPGAGTWVTLPGAIGGPVVVSASGSGVLATQRVQYYGSFNEAAGRTAAAAATLSFMPWYDLASPGMVADNIHLLNPAGTAVSGNVWIPGGPSVNFTVPAGGEWFGSLGAALGGPVEVRVNGSQGVLASQRVQYYQTFNEAQASG